MKNLVYILLIFIWSCGNSDIDNEILKTNPSLKDIILIDTFKNELIYDTANLITVAEFHPMYIGPQKDSFILNYNTRNVNNLDFWTIKEWSEISFDSLDINIYVDSSQIIGSAGFFSNFKKDKSSNDRGHFKSYPVFIQNFSVDTLDVGFGDYIPLIIEAKDSLGEWKPIQKPYLYGCGTGLLPIHIPSHEIMMTSCKLFEGNYKTKMRLVYYFNTSNEFDGQMNYSQFNEE